MPMGNLHVTTGIVINSNHGREAEGKVVGHLTIPDNFVGLRKHFKNNDGL